MLSLQQRQLHNQQSLARALACQEHPHPSLSAWQLDGVTSHFGQGSKTSFPPFPGLLVLPDTSILHSLWANSAALLSAAAR